MNFVKAGFLGFAKRNTQVGRFLRKFPPPKDLRRYALLHDNLEDLWRECPRPEWMLWMLDNFEFRPADALRLFACYSARRFSNAMADPRCMLAVEMAEKFARREIDWEEMDVARQGAYKAMEEAKARENLQAENVAWAAASTAKEDPFTAASDTLTYTTKVAELQGKDVKLLREMQAAKLRDLIGNPFKKIDDKKELQQAAYR